MPAILMRKLRMMRYIFVTFCTIIGTYSPAQTASGQPDITGLVAQLHSEEWTNRARAYAKLQSNPKMLSRVTVQAALLDLLDRENRLVESTLRGSQERVGVSDKYGEGYGEYVSKLGDTVGSFADWKDQRQACIMVNQSYNPDSRFAAEVASHGEEVVPCLMQMSRSDVGLTRAEAVPVLVQVISKARTQLDPGTTEEIRQTIIRALHDPHEAVRNHTVEALGSFGGEDMLPALKEVAQRDPSPEVQGNSIRKTAMKAIDEIEKRAGRN